MFSITRKDKVQMNFEGSPQCGNAGDMKFTVEVTAGGAELDKNGFVFDSFHLFELFRELQTGKWSGSCEGIGIFCGRWLFEKDPGVGFVEVSVTTESRNILKIDVYRPYPGDPEPAIYKHAIKRVE